MNFNLLEASKISNLINQQILEKNRKVESCKKITKSSEQQGVTTMTTPPDNHIVLRGQLSSQRNALIGISKVLNAFPEGDFTPVALGRMQSMLKVLNK